jgi:hypothetical protein
MHTMRGSVACAPVLDGMVFTDRVVIRDNRHTRRRILGATAAASVGATLAGCGIFGAGPDRPAAPDPLQPVLDEALALAAAYDRATVLQPGLAKRLAPLAADHRAHVAELTRAIGTSAPSAPASSAPPAGDATATLQSLRAAERAALRTASVACRRAPAARAALVGSIAACRATHAEALR